MPNYSLFPATALLSILLWRLSRR